MAIQDTDLLLINRGGTSYYVKRADINSKVQDDDLALVNRGGVSYKLTGDKLKAGTYNDSDLFLVNRSGQSYKCLGSELKSSTGLPLPTNAEWSYVTKEASFSKFKLTVTFQSSINTAVGTNFNFDLTSSGSPVGLAALQALEGTDTATVWLGSTTGPTITADSSLTTFQGGGIYASIIIKIPVNIKYDGSNNDAKGALKNGNWRTVVSVTQNGETSFGRLAQSFTPTESMFP